MPVKVTLKINMDKLNEEEQLYYKQSLITEKGFICNTINDIDGRINIGVHNLEKIENELNFPEKNSYTTELNNYIRALDRNFPTLLKFSRIGGCSKLSSMIYSVDIAIGEVVFEKL